MEYQAQVGSGAADPDVYEAFLKKMEENGIDKVLAVYQEQLDAWLAEQK